VTCAERRACKDTYVHLLSRLLPFAFLAALSACVAAPAPLLTPGNYAAVQDGEFLIPAVDPRYLNEITVRNYVAYTGPEAPGTIVVDPYARRLYFVIEDQLAMRYAIAVGRAGLAFRGNGTVQRKREWPPWTPTANMIRTFPEFYAEYAGGLPGGLSNPLGARALYLYRNGRDTYYRIHGTAENSSIGRATSAGCIRLFNQDAIDLFERVSLGTPVVVRSREESLALEGPFMDDAFGRAVPETPENIAQRERDLQMMAEQGIVLGPEGSFLPPDPAAAAGGGTAVGAEEAVAGAAG
jgi:lipoprotein-anchoring transpeptidase ErfK/SrfK